MGGRVNASRRVVAGLLVLQVLIGTVGIGAWRATSASAPAVPTVGAGGTAPAVLPATLESGREIALGRADAWQAGARLFGATMQVDWPWEPPPVRVTSVPGTGWLTYVFVAPWHPAGRREQAASLSVLIERLSGSVRAETSRGWGEAPPSEGATPAVVSSTAAVLAAEAAGGTGFRRGCPAYRHMTRVSLVTGTAWPAHWLVTYEDMRAPGRHGLEVRVDAATAKVLEMASDAPPCEAAGASGPGSAA
jgi:hypothetical protein